MKNINKYISLLLCIVILFSMLVHSTPTIMATQKSAKITLEGQKIEDLTIEQTEKKILSVVTSEMEAPSLQWQILLDPQNFVWVDIYDRTESDCEVSYALVKNMLDDANSTYIRCAATSNEETIYSNEVCVTILLEQEPAPQVTSFAPTRYLATKTSKAPTKFAMPREAVKEYVTITVKYLDIASLGGAQESAIYSPYTATIESGSSFKQSVVSPTFLGFAPYTDSNGDGVINDDDQSAATLNFNEDSVTENIEIKVYYKPIKVNYAVKYFFQNINDDLYVEDPSRYHTDKAETGTIVTNEYLESNAGVTTGFTKMYHIPENVAADGSTVFECYYDRNYYLIQFDLNDGYGVDPIYARYGTPFIVNNPIRHGYTFTGWKLIGIDINGNGEWDDTIPAGTSTDLISTIPEYNYYYQAQWETVNTNYTTVYWLKNANGGYDYLGSKIIGEKSGKTVSGSNDLANSPICGLAEHNHSEAAGCYGNCTETVYWHAHSEDCLSCDFEEHTHGNACKTDTKYFVYERADSNVLVEGDGSTVVNVYYKPKEYTLRFYYAATTGTGRDTDGDGVADTFDSVKIIGGSSYSFGASGTSTSNDATLLNNIFGTNQAGTVTKLPQLNATGKARNYTHGTLVSGATSYHYIEFTAGYGQDISQLWPCSVFDSATRTSINNNTNGWTGDQAFVSAWNGEHHVHYSQHNDNQTIKGNYEKLDYQLLFHSKDNCGVPNCNKTTFTDETTVSYLCFWENGAGNVNWNVPKLFVYRIWVPVLAGEDTTAFKTKTLNGVTYKLIESYDTCDDSQIAQQTQPSLEGYTALTELKGKDGDDDGIIEGEADSKITLTEEQAKMYKEGYNVNFYYKREKNPFAMKNHGDYIVNIKLNDSGEGGVPYETQLSTLSELDILQDDFEPAYPDTLEENAYYFEGWYTTEQCLPGTKVNLSTLTMPASGLILYANWVPETHTARFFTTYDDLLAYKNGTSTEMHYSASVEHGETVGTVETPERVGDGSLNLTFAGWFYMENGQKKAYSPFSFPINSDMNIFAEWSSHSPQPYRISYVLKDNPSVKVADDTTGYAYGGTTRTFTAKAGDPYNQLYEQYNNGYFPTVSSHSITIQAEADKDHPQNNVFTFHYVYAQEIKYTVRYVNKETNVVMDTVEYTTTSAVITERFRAYPNMVPDAFYKRLVLEVKEDENGHWVGTDNNVITFYYTPNDTSAYYAVHFMLEKPGATDAEKANYDINGNGGYEETGTHIEGVGKIGNTVNIIPQNVSGFTLIKNGKVPIVLSDGTQSVATKSGDDGYGITVTQSGTELYFFYQRNDYPYKVHYYEYNTTNSLRETKEGEAPYDWDLTETAPSIPDYTCVSESTQTITIREDEDGSKGLNVIIFYYAPLQYVAEYVAVPDDGGWLSNTIEVISGTQELVGSVPTANQYYEFAGWYLDEACTQSATSVGTFDKVTNRFTPDKSKLSETERNIFYAKFIKKVGNLTIVRSNAQDADQVFVYEIKNNDTNEVIYVTVTGNGQVTIKDLLLGNYTVTQQNNWSWRYEDAPVGSFDHQNDKGTTVHFGKVAKTEQWLNGNSAVKTNTWGQLS